MVCHLPTVVTVCEFPLVACHLVVVRIIVLEAIVVLVPVMLSDGRRRWGGRRRSGDRLLLRMRWLPAVQWRNRLVVA